MDSIKAICEEFFVLRGIRSAFNFYVEVDKFRFLIKYLRNLDGIEKSTCRDLFVISAMVNAIPLIIAELTNNGPMDNDTLYIRWNIPAVTEKGFYNLITSNLRKVKFNRIFYVDEGDHPNLPIKNKLVENETTHTVRVKVPKLLSRREFISSPARLIIKDSRTETQLVDFHISLPTKRKKEKILTRAGEIIGFTYQVVENPKDVLD